ncbi:MAG: trypsin-like peptidase domain-containing protein, partial [Candidatus Delongbacteria bacterium]
QGLKYFIHGTLTGLLIASIMVYIGLSRDIIINSSRDMSVSDKINQDRESAITRAVESVSPAVVGINVLKTAKQKVITPFDSDPFFSNFFPPQYRDRIIPSMGSGFIFTPDGYIMTNHHVIKNAQRIIVTTTDGKEYDAKIIGSDERSDIAVLKIEVKDHEYTKHGETSEISIGEWVIAFGNPYGLFEYINKPLITVGVVSGLGINFGFNTSDKHFYETMIQTDASINPGNSGGPLVNSKGEVIGMNTMIYSAREGGSIGIGFAIPMNKVTDIATTLIEKGHINRDFYFGFAKLSNIKPDFFDPDGKDDTTVKGVLVEKIQRSSPADRAGFKKGDIIIAVDNVKINNFNDMGKALMEVKDYKVGDKVNFIVYRNDEHIKLTLVLEPFLKNN